MTWQNIYGLTNQNDSNQNNMNRLNLEERLKSSKIKKATPKFKGILHKIEIRSSRTIWTHCTDGFGQTETKSKLKFKNNKTLRKQYEQHGIKTKKN